MNIRQDRDLSLLSHPKAWPCKDRIFLKKFDEIAHTMDTGVLFQPEKDWFAFWPDGGEARQGGLDLLETLVLKEGWKVD